MHGLLHSLTPVLLKVRLVFFVCECFVGVRWDLTPVTSWDAVAGCETSFGGCRLVWLPDFVFSKNFNLLSLSAASVCSWMNFNTFYISFESFVATFAHFSCSLYGTSLINLVPRRLPYDVFGFPRVSNAHVCDWIVNWRFRRAATSFGSFNGCSESNLSKCALISTSFSRRWPATGQSRSGSLRRLTLDSQPTDGLPL